jgi:hypothetical protein
VAGKGFVPFGSDDPMTRRPARYPVNHHLAQILERGVLIGQAELGPALIEASLFNGDEPERPSQWPRLARFGDSWALRISLAPIRWFEATASLARVASPEHRPGAGSTQHKVHLGLRYRNEAGTGFGMVEWMRTSELDGFFRFRSLLAEGAWRPSPVLVYYRFERTERPEESRLTAFRTARPHLENSIVGITRWTLHTVGIELAMRLSNLEISPFLEATTGRGREVGPGLFRVVDQYGGPAVEALGLGVRVGWRDGGHRMGRYGLAEPATVAGGHHHGGVR